MDNMKYVLKGAKYAYVLKDDVAETLGTIGGVVKSFAKICLAAGAAYSLKEVLNKVCRSNNEDFTDGVKQCVNKVINSVRD